jgi:hypothetical protein
MAMTVVEFLLLGVFLFVAGTRHLICPPGTFLFGRTHRAD